MIKDSQELRDLLPKLLPGMAIELVASPSGQRVVYFANFSKPAATLEQCNWGPVVVKVAEQLNPRQIAYLEKEITLLNNLSSLYYPKLLFYETFTHHPDTDDPLPHRMFISIEERVQAQPLDKVRAMFSSEGKVCSLLIDLIDGLDLLWSRPEKIIHRDLKPANILILKNQRVVIIDLGIVREEGTPGLTDDEAEWGPCTPPYASPEQAKNEKSSISFKSDFFTLGTIAYELLTGSNPYFDPKTDTRMDVIEKVRFFIPKPLHQLGLTTKAFSNVIETVMKKEPFERFRTVSRFKQALIDSGEVSHGS